MSKAERLYQIVEILRQRGCTSATYLAERLNVSSRSIYRYMDDLSVSGVPILSEPGKGFWLDQRFELAPLNLSHEELLALSLGARMVKQVAEPKLAEAAQSLLDKIETGLPDNQHHRLKQVQITAPMNIVSAPIKARQGQLRQALEQQTKVAFLYQDEQFEQSQRLAWPLALAFWGKVWTLAAWCESRQDYRSFRLDRMDALKLLDQTFVLNESINLERFRQQQAELGLIPADSKPSN